MLDRETSRNNPSKEMHEMSSQGYGKAYPAIMTESLNHILAALQAELRGASHTIKYAWKFTSTHETWSIRTLYCSIIIEG